MGRRARQKGITGAALRAAQAALREADQEAAIIAQRVYETAVRMRPTSEQSGAAVWMLAGTAFLAEEGATRLATQRGMTEREAVLLAAYVNQGLQATLVALLRDFDEEHFAEWCRAFAEETRAGT